MLGFVVLTTIINIINLIIDEFFLSLSLSLYLLLYVLELA